MFEGQYLSLKVQRQCYITIGLRMSDIHSLLLFHKYTAVFISLQFCVIFYFNLCFMMCL